MNFREYGLHEEIEREKENRDGKVLVYDPFDSSFPPEKVERKVYRRKERWMVKLGGNWCELTGYQLEEENPRMAGFRVDIRNKY